MKLIKQAALAVAMTCATGVASATTLGIDGQLFYSGGQLDIQNEWASSGYANYTYLRTPGAGDQFLFIDNTSDLISFTQAQLAGLGINLGDELLFLIRPNNGGNAFFTGSDSRNPDGMHHANVADIGGGVYRVGFEDLYGGGDQDFDDANFLVLSGALPDPNIRVPEPAMVGLLGIGLLGIAANRRRQRIR